jgi:anaerobic magnesium-protoporphyrin IX monomethyl ester cyclase
MHVCFVTRLTEHLGIQLLSAICKERGHRVSHVFDPGIPSAGVVPGRWLPAFLSTDDVTMRRILETEPDVVGFNVEINTFSWTVELAQRLKAARPELTIVVGGVHATTVPEVVMGFGCFDFLCVGEGDDALPELLEAIESEGDVHGVANFWSRRGDELVRNPVRPLLTELDDLPFFDKSIHYDLIPEMSREYHTNASRGCVYSCSFCFYQPIQKVYGGRFRTMRSPANVCAELEQAMERYPTIRTVTFHDEVFTANKPWLREFAELWPKRVGLPFAIITHPELVGEEVAELLGKAGCVHCIMGTQTVNEHSRVEVLDRTETPEDVRRAIRVLKEQGIWVIVDHILGIPGETEQDQDDALLFYAECAPDVIKAFFLTYLPGTDINQHGLDSGDWTLEQLKDAERGQLDSWLFKGVGDIPEWRAYYQLFTLFTVVPPHLMSFAVRHKLHKAMKALDPVFLPSLFLVPRVARSLLGGREEQPRAFVNYFKGLGRYTIEQRFGHRRRLTKLARRALRPARGYRSWWGG